MNNQRIFTAVLVLGLLLGTVAGPAAGPAAVQAKETEDVFSTPLEQQLGRAASTSLCFDAIADTTAYSFFPNNNYGDSSALQVASIGDVDVDRRWSFLQFDLSAIPDGSVVLSADLEIYLTQSTYGGSGFLQAVEGAWSETGLTWANQPSLGTEDYDEVSWGAGATGWQTWQADRLVSEWVLGARSNDGLAVTARGLGTPPSSFHSREGSSTQAPRLCVEWEPYTNVLDPNGTGWRSGRNYTSSAFGDWFSDLSSQGYMMVDIEVDEIDGEQRVGGVWQRNADGRAWRETRNMSLSTFENFQQSRADAGYRVIDQETYVLGTSTYYAAIWIENRENLPWANYYDVTSSEFSTLFSTYSGMGYIITDVDAYVIDGQLLYSAVWVYNVENLDWHEWRNLSSAEFADRFAEYRDDFRMIDVESYRVGGTQYYAGIWVENRNGRAWAEWRNLTSKGFGEKWAQLRDAGYRLIEYEVYPTGSGWRYAGIWRQNTDRPDWSLKGDVDTLLQDYFDDADLPGMSVAIAQDGRFRYLRGFGDADVDDSVATDSRTVYRLASVSKAVAGVLGLRLAEEGLLDLSADSRDYVPAMPDHHTHTVSQTLSNRSGIGHYSDHPDWKEQVSGADDEPDVFATALEAAERLWDDPLSYPPPGSTYRYSTHAYTYAGASMEEAVGEPIQDLLVTYLGSPYNLSTLRAEDRSASNPKRSLLYKESGGENEEVSATSLSWKVLGGGMEASAYDLVRFGILLNDGTILTQGSRDQLWTRPDALANYALGWDVGTHLGSRVVAKRGTQSGARAYIRIYPDEDIVIVILTNRRSGHDPRPLGRDVGALMLGELSGAAPAANRLEPLAAAQEEVDEPDSEGLPAEYVVSPVSNPVVEPTTEDLEEPLSDGEPPLHGIYLPLVIR